ncbi:MAG: hypothetical protein CMN30_29205 [Sandaracinus sp.]|nr:hypothetical protein [Sandaracinus sp.]
MFVPSFLRSSPGPLLASLVFAAACASAPPPRPPAEAGPRHAALVEAEVIRGVAGEPDGALDHAREVAIDHTARNLDSLTPDEVRGYRLDVTLDLVTDNSTQLRVKALVAVNTVGPPEQMRAMLQGTGTVQRGTDRQADLELAAEGAVRAALRRLLDVTQSLP